MTAALAKRPAVIVAEGAFHGRTLLAMTMTSKVNPYKFGFGPFAPEIYRMPFGDVPIDTALARRIQQASQLIDIDAQGHKFEHSIEVQLPFLQYIYGKNFKLVPIILMMQDLNTSQDVGEAIGDTVAGKNVLIIASSDMSHYVPQKVAEAKDHLAFMV